MTPELKARQQIDPKLEKAGWVIQDMKELNLSAGVGVAVRECPTDTGPADYMLFVNRVAVGVIEAKKDSAGENLTVTEIQTERYATSSLKWRKDDTPLRFLFEATGQIIRFTDNADPVPRSREIFNFFKPEALATWLAQPETLRRRLAEQMPALPELNLRDCQISAVTGLEQSLALNKPRALVHMATGAGKTFTAITSVYRLLKFGGAKRILFLVDMYEVFSPYLESYDSKLRNGIDPGLKRLFYAMPVHSQFVLLAFMIQQSDVVRAFLDDHLGIDPDDGIESVLFVLRQPPWKSKAPDGDPRFWNARGVVRDFLSRLHDIALAPIEISRQVSTSIWNKTKLQFKYLYVKDIAALRRLVGNQAPAQFFRDLESTYVSELIEEVRIRIRLKKNDGSVTFRELSEGEQQLLTVLGLLRFTAEDESLFLLDEPDTHLNPRWSVDYISYLKQFIANGTKQEETSHILLTTHNPLAVAELDREQVQILRMSKQEGQRQILACYPEVAPRGMGYAAIVTSDMFGIASSMDASTQLQLEKQRALGAKPDLSVTEQGALDEINDDLNRLGFRFFHPDDEFSRYLRLRNEALKARFGVIDPLDLAEKAVTMTRQEREDLATDLITKLVEDENEELGGPSR
ncbi:AAA family ATPase [Pseudomonas syringae]|nr:AAA family ATPase [Pseudomonas syringae]